MKSSTHFLSYFFSLALLLAFLNPQKGEAQLLRTFSGHDGSVNSVAFSPDGTKVLSGSNDNTLKLWETATGKLMRTFSGHTRDVKSVAFSPDGTQVLSGSGDYTLKLWETHAGKLLRTFSGHDSWVESVAFSPDGKKVLSGSDDNTLKLWETATGRLLRTFSGHENYVMSVAFSPDGRKVLSGSYDETLKLWEADTGRIMHTYPGHYIGVVSVDFSPDGTYVLSGSGDKSLKLWDTATGKIVRTFYGHEGNVASVAFSPDGTQVLSGSTDGTIKLWETATGKLLRTFSVHDLDVHSVTFSPDGTQILTGSDDNTMRLWDVTPKGLITAKVQQKIESWQQKGKYESTQGYRERVTETKRRELIKRYTAELVDSLGRSRFKPTITSQYDADSTKIEPLYKALKQIPSPNELPDYDSFAKDFEDRDYRRRIHDYLITQQEKGNAKGVDDSFESFEARILGKELNAFEPNISTTNYDADNEVFEVTLADSSSIYVNVPVAEAPAFDQNLDRLRFCNMDFTLTSGGELVLRKAQIHNPANDNIYDYDSGREVAFNTAELAANFDPIDVEVQTEDVGANVEKGTQKIEVGKADVDVNIPETAMSKPDGIAVVIGNRRYQGDTPDVDYAVNDANMMRKYLIKTLGFRPGNILYEENAGLSRMRVLFGDERNEGKLANYLKPGRSDVFVFYSGHGAPDPNTETGYLMPVDGDATALNITGYPLETLYDNLAKLDAKSVSVVIDACFSGASGGGEMLVDKASPIGIEVQNPAAQLDNGFVVTASSGSQISSWYPEKSHGLLTYFWLKGLRGAADQNGDKAITASEIRAYLNDNSDGLPYWARRLHNREQTPQVYGMDENKVIVEYK